MNEWKKIKYILSNSEEESFIRLCKDALQMKEPIEGNLDLSIVSSGGDDDIKYEQAIKLVNFICDNLKLDKNEVVVPVFEIVKKNEKGSMIGVIWFAKYIHEGTIHISYTEKTI